MVPSPAAFTPPPRESGLPPRELDPRSLEPEGSRPQSSSAAFRQEQQPQQRAQKERPRPPREREPLSGSGSGSGSGEGVAEGCRGPPRQRPTSERPMSDRPMSERLMSERLTSERPMSERGPSILPARERWGGGSVSGPTQTSFTQDAPISPPRSPPPMLPIQPQPDDRDYPSLTQTFPPKTAFRLTQRKLPTLQRTALPAPLPHPKPRRPMEGPTQGPRRGMLSPGCIWPLRPECACSTPGRVPAPANSSV